MARASYGTWRIEPVPFETVRQIAVEILTELGYKVHRRSLSKQRLKVEGIRGSKWLAYLGQVGLFGELFGIGSRVKATVTCRRSLTEGDRTFQLAVRCAPVQEWDSMEEEFLVTQGYAERIGDNYRARQCFIRLVQTLRTEGILADAYDDPGR